MDSLKSFGAALVVLIGLAGPLTGVYVNLSTQIAELTTIISQRTAKIEEHKVFRDRISDLNAEISSIKIRIKTLEEEEDISSRIIGELRTAVAQLEVIVRILGEAK
tara:strand:+ start:555 stop:872 length:318 start_codon:yes stop_codon:yes gene_type:complete